MPSGMEEGKTLIKLLSEIVKEFDTFDLTHNSFESMKNSTDV